MPKVSSSTGYVQLPDGEGTVVCQFSLNTNSQGSSWLGHDPLEFTVPVVLLQLVVIFAVTSTVWFLIRPFKQGLISAQLIAGIIMGKSFLGQIEAYSSRLFPPGGRTILETFAVLGFMFYLFILGVQIDLTLVRKLQRNAVVIGVAGFLSPLVIGLVAVCFIFQYEEIGASLKQSLPFVVSVTAISSFPVITSLLADLNILNSEMGRIATLASLVSDICNYVLSYVFGSMAVSISNKQVSAMLPVLASVVFTLVLAFGVGPTVNRVAKGVREGRKMNEVQFIFIAITVLLCGLCSQIIGLAADLGTFLMGVVVPHDLGSSFVNKLDTITVGFLVPAKFVLNGLRMDILSINWASGAVVGLVILISYAAKFAVIFGLATYYNLPARNAVSLALVMCCRGVVDAALYFSLRETQVIDNEAYALLLISMLIETGIARPLIGHLYDPSARYLSLRKNSILLNHPNAELRILVCLHNADNVPTIVDLLDASTPMRNRTLAVFVLNLIELKGSAASVLESNLRRSELNSSGNWAKHVANAFNSFSERYQDSVVVRHFTSMAPYASMHDDICTLGLDRNANIVIIPFHKQWTADGDVGATSSSIRTVNQNVLSKSPCSVGVLIDRGQTARRNHSVSMFQISVLFLGGMDDCEATAFCSRFIENPRISLTFVWIRPWDHNGYGGEEMDTEAVNQFRAKTIGNERITYKEEMVKDAIGTTRVIRSVEDSGSDLCIVGRYHDPYSSLLLGLTDWNEFPELGLVGGMLASSDFGFSVLVVQKQPPGQRASSANWNLASHR